MSEYQYDQMLNRWTHPDSGTSINDEDMPWELKPEEEP